MQGSESTPGAHTRCTLKASRRTLLHPSHPSRASWLWPGRRSHKWHQLFCLSGIRLFIPKMCMSTICVARPWRLQCERLLPGMSDAPGLSGHELRSLALEGNGSSILICRDTSHVAVSMQAVAVIQQRSHHAHGPASASAACTEMLVRASFH